MYICPRIIKKRSVKAKDNRLQTIQNILLERNVSTQEELLSELAHHGFSLTQATLSRDLKKLKIAKLHTEEGVYRYSLPQASSNKVSDVLKDSPEISLAFSGNLAVLRTKPGYAAALASQIDASDSKLFLGTVAGDDTVLLILRENVSQKQAKEQLSQIIKHIIEV